MSTPILFAFAAAFVPAAISATMAIAALAAISTAMATIVAFRIDDCGFPIAGMAVRGADLRIVGEALGVTTPLMSLAAISAIADDHALAAVAWLWADRYLLTCTVIGLIFDFIGWIKDVW